MNGVRVCMDLEGFNEVQIEQVAVIKGELSYYFLIELRRGRGETQPRWRIIHLGWVPLRPHGHLGITYSGTTTYRTYVKSKPYRRLPKDKSQN